MHNYHFQWHKYYVTVRHESHLVIMDIIYDGSMYNHQKEFVYNEMEMLR